MHTIVHHHLVIVIETIRVRMISAFTRASERINCLPQFRSAYRAFHSVETALCRVYMIIYAQKQKVSVEFLFYLISMLKLIYLIKSSSLRSSELEYHRVSIVVVRFRNIYRKSEVRSNSMIETLDLDV